MSIHVFIRKGSRERCRDKFSRLLVCRCCVFAPEHSNHSDFQYRERLIVNNNNQNLSHASIKDFQLQSYTMVTLRSAAPGHERIIWTNGGLKATSITTANNTPSTSNKSPHATRHMAKKDMANRVTKKSNTRTKATSSKVTRRQEKKSNPSAGPTRRSTRLAQGTSQPMGDEDLLTNPTADVLDALQDTSPSSEPPTDDQKHPTDEGTMHDYMIAIRRRVDALESREFLLAAINAPYWSDELHRDLLKEVVKVWLAISSGQFQDVNEVIQLPLEHAYWTEETRVTSTVSLPVWALRSKRWLT